MLAHISTLNALASGDKQSHLAVSMDKAKFREGQNMEPGAAKNSEPVKVNVQMLSLYAKNLGANIVSKAFSTLPPEVKKQAFRGQLKIALNKFEALIDEVDSLLDLSMLMVKVIDLLNKSVTEATADLVLAMASAMESVQAKGAVGIPSCAKAVEVFNSHGLDVRTPAVAAATEAASKLYECVRKVRPNPQYLCTLS